MYRQIESASEALRASASGLAEKLTPALCGCPGCGTIRAIVSPALGVCAECGTQRVVHRAPETVIAAA